MTTDTLKYYFDCWAEFNSCFAYRAPFQERFTNAIIDLSEQNKEHQNAGLNRKASFMLVECFQNIIKHSESLEENQMTIADGGMFSFKFLDAYFIINSINIIRKADIAKLTTQIEQVNSLDEAALKQHYMKHLENNAISEKGGAGLGLIELARKSGQKILYKFKEIDSEHSQFHQQITFKRQAEHAPEFAKFLEDNDAYYASMKDKKIFLQYKGDFTQKAILPILLLTEQRYNADLEEKEKTKRAKHVLIEILQNIGRVSKSEDSETHKPTLILGKNENHLYVLAGNVVNSAKKDILTEKLDYLLSLEDEELADLHRKTIKASIQFENKESTGLGLIQVVRSGVEKIKYKFYPIENDKFLFAISIKF
jgi:hypothetical protein